MLNHAVDTKNVTLNLPELDDNYKFTPLFNPEPDPESLKTDNLMHLKGGLYPHE